MSDSVNPQIEGPEQIQRLPMEKVTASLIGSIKAAVLVDKEDEGFTRALNNIPLTFETLVAQEKGVLSAAKFQETLDYYNNLRSFRARGLKMEFLLDEGGGYIMRTFTYDDLRNQAPADMAKAPTSPKDYAMKDLVHVIIGNKGGDVLNDARFAGWKYGKEKENEGQWKFLARAESLVRSKFFPYEDKVITNDPAFVTLSQAKLDLPKRDIMGNRLQMQSIRATILTDLAFGMLFPPPMESLDVLERRAGGKLSTTTAKGIVMLYYHIEWEARALAAYKSKESY